MKKIKSIISVLVIMMLVVSSLLVSDQSTILAADNIINIDAGSSKSNATEIASSIYYAKEGTTIVLKEGYYEISGQAYLRENNITVKGAGKDKTFIFVKSADEGWGITVTGDSCTLQDLTVQRSDNPNNAAVIKIMGGNNTSIKNVKTIGGFYGIDVNPSIGCVIDGCEITKTAKGSIGIGSANNSKSEVTIMNTTTRSAGWKTDVIINDSNTYGSSKVLIKKGNWFTNGTLCNDNYKKSSMIFDENMFPTYKEIIEGNVKAYVEESSIDLSSKQLLLEVGKTANIKGIVSPANPIRDITWSSSNEEIAKVDMNGKITAISKGEAKIIASAGETRSSCLVKTFKTESNIPTLDPTKPTDKVDVGVADEESKEIVNDTSSTILDAIAKNEDVSSSIISKNTLEKVKDAIDKGETITTKVESKPIETSQVKEEERVKINESIDSLVTKNESVVKVAQYLDIGVVLQANNKDLGNIYELNNTITFTVAIPKELKVEGRKFYVIRIHEGQSCILDARMNDDGTLSFGTDCFSTYALVYEDQKGTTIEPEEPNPILPPETDGAKPDNIVQTSDITLFVPMLCLMSISLGIVLKLQLIKKKK